MVGFLGFDLMLPPPLDNPGGDFLLLMSLWAVAATVAAIVLDRVVRRAVGYTESNLDDRLLAVSHKPLVAVILLYGFQSSFSFVAEFSVDVAVPGLPQVVTWTQRIAGLLIAFAILYWAYKLLDEVLIHYAGRWADRTETNLDDALVPVGEKALLAIIIFFGFSTVLGTFGVDITMLVAGAGLAGLVIAFAAQDTLSNFFSGIFLLLDRPFKEGDWITLKDGRVVQVQRVGLRSTRFYHAFEHTLITVPNRIIAEDEITDLMEPDNRYRQNVEIGVAYGTDLDHAKQVIYDAVVQHPNVLTEPEDLLPSIYFTGFGDSSLNFRALFWVDHVENRWKAKDEVGQAVKEAIEEAQITIPFPQRSVWFQNVLEGKVGDGRGELPGKVQDPAGEGP